MDDVTKKEVMDTLRSEGLQVAEDMAVNAIRAAFMIMRIVIPKVSIVGGTIIGPMIGIVEPKVLELLDKIDGVDDPNY